jgi:hypothetical protein
LLATLIPLSRRLATSYLWISSKVDLHHVALGDVSYIQGANGTNLLGYLILDMENFGKLGTLNLDLLAV